MKFVIASFLACSLMSGCRSDIKELESASIQYGCLDGTLYVLDKYKIHTKESALDAIDYCKNNSYIK